MKLKKKFSDTLLGLLLLLFGGCSISPLRVAVINSNKLVSRSEIPFYSQASDQTDFSLPDSRQGERWRVKYHSSFAENRWMVVEGKLENGRSYPVVLDTGATPPLFVTDVHIMENKLPIYPLSGDGESVGWGLCHLSGLYVGSLQFDTSSCTYKEQHTEIQIFGLPAAIDKAIIAGLPLLRQFSYISFDSVSREAEFSRESKFQPLDLTAWAQYNLDIQEDLAGNVSLFVTIPIARLDTKLQLDTGSGRGLAIRSELWSQLQNRIHSVKLKKGTELYPYIGLFDCQKGSIANLEVGNRTIHSAQLSILSDDCSLVENCNGLIGMQYFQDTVIVLDFSRNLLWVRNSQNN